MLVTQAIDSPLYGAVVILTGAGVVLGAAYQIRRSRNERVTSSH